MVFNRFLYSKNEANKDFLNLKHKFKISASLAFSQAYNIIDPCSNQKEVKNKPIVNYSCYFVSLRNNINTI